jgi:hypothetical protein
MITMLPTVPTRQAAAPATIPPQTIDHEPAQAE